MTTESKKAFTLTELLIVIGLLVLMLVLALPAVNFITGARSTESATNVIGALLGTARAQAIARQDKVGVLFFWDRTKEQTSAAIVTAAQPWANATSYVIGDVVLYNGTYYIATGPSANNAPGAGTIPIPWDTASTYLTTTFMPVFSDDFDIQTLPKGVGLQGVVLPDSTTPADTSTVQNHDHYVSTCLILFDSEGRLTFTPYGIYGIETVGASTIPSRLGALLNSARNCPSTVGGPDMGLSQAAIVLYDVHAFHDAGYTEQDFLIGDYGAVPPTTFNNTPEYNEEIALSSIPVSDTTNNPTGVVPLDTTFLLVNRYNGTLFKSE